MSWSSQEGDARLARAPFVIRHRAVPTDRQSGRRPRFEPVVAGGHGAIWRVQYCPGEHLATLVAVGPLGLSCSRSRRGVYSRAVAEDTAVMITVRAGSCGSGPTSWHAVRLSPR